MSRYRYRYVRPVRNGRWQARIWLGEREGFLNLGTYPAALDAWAVVRRYLNQGEMPDGILPRWVRRATFRNARGQIIRKMYYARTKIEGKKFQTPLFPEAMQAQKELRKLLVKAFGSDWEDVLYLLRLERRRRRQFDAWLRSKNLCL